jgi:RNA polymerase sigma-70 factor (ECF subfamily)
LRSVQGLNYAQISLALDIPLGTVMSRLARARDQIRKLIDAPAEPCQTSGPVAKISI